MPQSMLSSEKWYGLLGQIVDAVGENSFCQLVADATQHISGYDSTVFIAFIRNQRPQLIFSNLSKQDETPTLGPYFDGAYLLDPFYDLFRHNAEDGVYRLKEVAPDEFFDTEYYRSYFMSTRIIDETGMLLKINDDIHLSISCGLREGSMPPDLKIKDLRTIFPFVASSCRQHWSRESELSRLLSHNEGGTEFSITLETAFNNFGKDYLTNRECQVLHLILKGYASKSIAQLLEISLDTVKVHRKRFHAKLGVSSQAELFALFLESIAMVPSGSEQDPLVYYFEGQAINPASE
ncbi:MAG: helix-turn-helix transcriptional regulator [Gammaproteobacteria bacterium]|nr:helix-turn-helix transcriptional regulator [Gammaproteobacteria bacterium]